MGGINPNLNDCSRSDMERLCPYSSASSDDEEVTSITLLRFAIGGVRRIKYLLSKCTHGVDPLWASSAAPQPLKECACLMQAIPPRKMCTATPLYGLALSIFVIPHLHHITPAHIKLIQDRLTRGVVSITKFRCFSL